MLASNSYKILVQNSATPAMQILSIQSLPTSLLHKSYLNKKTACRDEESFVRYMKVQGVPCARGLGFVDLDLECSTTLLGQ